MIEFRCDNCREYIEFGTIEQAIKAIQKGDWVIEPMDFEMYCPRCKVIKGVAHV